MANRKRPDSRKVIGRDGNVYYVTPKGFVTGFEAPRPMQWTSYRVTHNASPWYWDGGMYDSLGEAILDL